MTYYMIFIFHVYEIVRYLIIFLVYAENLKRDDDEIILLHIPSPPHFPVFTLKGELFC